MDPGHRKRHQSGRREQGRDQRRHSRDYRHRDERRERRRSRSRSREIRDIRDNAKREKDYYEQRKPEPVPQEDRESSALGLTAEQLIEREKIHQIRVGIRHNNLDPNLLEGISKARERELIEQERQPSRLDQPILVRELFIGGVKEMSRHTLQNVLNVYGQIEAIDPCKNFVFVKYKRVMDASLACSNYQKINQSLHAGSSNSSFKLFFSDHFKRYNVVGDHPSVQSRQNMLPVLFVSFRGDSTLNEPELLKIFSKYGYIRYMRMIRQENPSLKIVTLIEFEELDQAILARDRISAHKDKLRDRNCQVSILLNSLKAPSYQLKYIRKNQMRMALPSPFVPQPGFYPPMDSAGYPPLAPPHPMYTSLPPVPISAPPLAPLPPMPTGLGYGVEPWRGTLKIGAKRVRVWLQVVYGTAPRLGEQLAITMRAEFENYREKRFKAKCIWVGQQELGEEGVFKQLSQYFNSRNRAGVVKLSADQQIWIAIQGKIEAFCIPAT